MTPAGDLPDNAVTDELVRGRYRLGPETELLVLSDGTAHFDGGAMFGVVPKALWGRVVASDAENRVVLGLNTVVVRTAAHTVVIETGFGEKLPPKAAAITGAQARLLHAFAAAGVEPASVDMVINSHLHWDHCGWNTRFVEGGQGVVPTFPNARYFAHAGEVAHGRAQHERDRISYLADNYEPLLATGQMTALDVAEGEERELAPGIAVELFPGHTRQLMAIHVRDGASGKRACYISDLVPTAAHLPLTWGMGFDLDPMRVIAEKKRFYARAIAEQWLVLFTHDAATPAGYLEAAKAGAVLRSEGS
ncbi:MBL fold metallo-hydrolase [Acidipila sp. EB88]|uniref:MBL fold metallo-hydrolase n=1 Tax=Acidipila sp. EB88 TaxID=2305226 RepID=UPI000F5FE6F7|nr:MBL fold metallo-hydrolase [Acidipila sp. EB88]RRA48532.1 MBL fold metallo-hydrolase [Acidipila sp. EB88]